ncbi:MULTISPECIES: RluA family pseudouridine synthase [unclassified Synechocystis]|uniref:RluA family pseudouridine synthase n=1 Tax=unclassified Synechocystis TaxID=2640012 RepID=UPI0003F94B04|nr:MULTISPECIES: RluA family pseudouridine synthase [unclassified Synechocystis]AIE75346.1 Ribosomal large subunit pseudouridine synthase D [Synechocystis sp. PCC 6714]MCT0253581.1 RluA family pseudouridine synthase [Synechocystis sp. CS-94]
MSTSFNKGWLYTDVVTAKGSGQTVLDFYSQRYTHSDRQTWQERIESGQIQVDGHSVKTSHPLQLGQTLTYWRSPWAEPEVPLQLPILYRDEDLWAIDKPAGLPVLPGGDFVYNTVLEQLKIQYPQESLFPLHRLGTGTSGLLLLGRSPLARQELSRQFREHVCRKIYRTLIGPCTLPEQFECHQAIGKIPYPQLGYIYAATPNGKESHSYGKILARSADKTWLEVEITTGRPHQIRIHLASLGYPLLGDRLYGPGGVPIVRATTARPSDGGYILHSHQLGFIHPRSHQKLTLTAPLPSDLTFSRQMAKE